jgi:hypothetical protein
LRPRQYRWRSKSSRPLRLHSVSATPKPAQNYVVLELVLNGEEQYRTRHHPNDGFQFIRLHSRDGELW